MDTQSMRQIVTIQLLTPSAEEICDNKDNDCNAEIDDGIGQMFYVDADGDGFGDENNQSEACDLRLGLSAVSGDCDDTNILISPSAVNFAMRSTIIATMKQTFFLRPLHPPQPLCPF